MKDVEHPFHAGTSCLNSLAVDLIGCRFKSSWLCLFTVCVTIVALFIIPDIIFDYTFMCTLIFIIFLLACGKEEACQTIAD